MALQVLTYNLLYTKGLSTLKAIIDANSPDIICFQEFELDNSHFIAVENMGYSLADYSFSFWKFLKLYGVATFYNRKKFHMNDHTSFDLGRSAYESLLNIIRFNKNHPRTVLHTQFKEKLTGRIIDIYNLHLTPWSTSGHRARQVEKTLDSISITKNPTIILGDFNHPYQRKKIEAIKDRNCLQEATSELRFTYTSKFLGFFPMQFKLDYIFYKNISLISASRLTNGSSDHFPILTAFT
jgi:endonuclease/exonuclease/phosphatase family metal-dependent hydrolase